MGEWVKLPEICTQHLTRVCIVNLHAMTCHTIPLSHPSFLCSASLLFGNTLIVCMCVCTSMEFRMYVLVHALVRETLARTYAQRSREDGMRLQVGYLLGKERAVRCGLKVCVGRVMYVLVRIPYHEFCLISICYDTCIDTVFGIRNIQTRVIAFGSTTFLV